jgi:hypothetical protein
MRLSTSSSLFSTELVMVDFYGPRLKTERAEHHIRDLQAIFRDYTRRNMERLRRQQKGRSLKGEPTLPRHAATVLGDALHNLRAALDYAYNIASDANSATWSDWRKFPFGKDRQSLEGSINGHKAKGIAPSDLVLSKSMDEIQPYERGVLDLYGLHKLDITDKHHVLIPTRREMRIDNLVLPGGGGIRGITLVLPNETKGAEFISAPGGAVLHGNTEGTFEICFENGQPYEGQSILETVKRLRANTEAALTIIENALKG